MTSPWTIVAFLSSFIWALCAQAIPTPTSTNELSQPTLSKLQRATVVLMNQSNGTFCSGFPISDDGYVLTAVHCLKDCLQKRNGSDPILCNQQSIPSLGVKGVTVVATGSALSQTRPSRAQDFAILKVKTEKPLSCLKLAGGQMAPGQKLWATGYPLTKSPKLVLKTSEGHLYKDPSESRYYQAQPTAAHKKKIAEIYSEPGVIYSNAHHLIGQSGGPVVDENAHVLGVISGFTVTRSGKKEVHEMVAGSTQTILSSLTPELASLLVEKSKSCE